MSHGKLQIAPSLLAADWTNIGGEVSAVERAGADLLHLDVMDGSFVPPISFGQDFVRSVKKITSLPLDVHLMIASPEKHLESFIQAGADILTFHVEATAHPHRLIQMIKGYGILAGIALNPGTPLAMIEPCLGDADLILVMTVNPGWGGQSFIPSMLDKIKSIAGHPSKRSETRIEVDGGINPETAKVCAEHGAEILVAGTSIFSSSDYADAISQLKNKDTSR